MSLSATSTGRLDCPFPSVVIKNGRILLVESDSSNLNRAAVSDSSSGNSNSSLTRHRLLRSLRQGGAGLALGSIDVGQSLDVLLLPHSWIRAILSISLGWILVLMRDLLLLLNFFFFHAFDALTLFEVVLNVKQARLKDYVVGLIDLAHLLLLLFYDIVPI